MIDDPTKARGMIGAAREAIRTTPELRPLADKLERKAAKVARIERVIASKVAAFGPVLR